MNTEKRVVVGVNRYQAPTPPIEKLQSIEQAEIRKQLNRLLRVRRERDGTDVRLALGRLDQAARDDANTVPAILECVEAYATVGEISDTLREVFGEQHEFTPF